MATHHRLLTIGNSFAGNALCFFRPLVADLGHSFTIGRANLGGCSLEKHWNLHQYSERMCDYITYTNGDAQGDDPRAGNLRQLLSAQPWDFVTLQQASIKTWDETSYEPYLGNLIAAVRELAPQAEILLHQTWSYRSDSPELATLGLSMEEMHARIDAAYRRFAREYGLRTLPSGPALYLARTQAGRAYVRDPAYPFAAPVAPLLPEQKHAYEAGYAWAISDTPDGVPELRVDGRHLNERGCFLASLIWAGVMTGGDIRQTSFCPSTITADDRAFLVDMAHRTLHAQQAGAVG